MNKQAFVTGFVKRATDYGFNENEAVGILKRSFSLGDIINLDDPGVIESFQKDPETMKNFMNFMSKFKGDGLKDMMASSMAGSGTMLGGGIGALGGAGIGALFKSKDEKGETHRGRNALIGALTGAGVGGASGGGLGYGAGAFTANSMNDIEDVIKRNSGNPVLNNLKDIFK